MYDVVEVSCVLILMETQEETEEEKGTSRVVVRVCQAVGSTAGDRETGSPSSASCRIDDVTDIRHGMGKNSALIQVSEGMSRRTSFLSLHQLLIFLSV